MESKKEKISLGDAFRGMCLVLGIPLFLLGCLFMWLNAVLGNQNPGLLSIGMILLFLGAAMIFLLFALLSKISFLGYILFWAGILALIIVHHNRWQVYAGFLIGIGLILFLIGGIKTLKEYIRSSETD